VQFFICEDMQTHACVHIHIHTMTMSPRALEDKGLRRSSKFTSPCFTFCNLSHLSLACTNREKEGVR